jgi:cell division transport system ATP-binding protein
MIHFKNISKKYGPDAIALRNINLHIRPKEFVSIIGQSGAGKTTLSKLLIGQEKPSTGNLVVGGWDITGIKNYEIPYLRRQIGVVYQDFNLLSSKTVEENVAYSLEVAGVPKKRIRKITDPLLSIVGLEGKGLRYPHQISGGESQRVAIARALAHRPKILVADEPTGNLDTINAQEILDLLKKINEFGTTVILMTHDKDIVNALKRRVVVMEHGEIVRDQESGKYSL